MVSEGDCVDVDCTIAACCFYCMVLSLLLLSRCSLHFQQGILRIALMAEDLRLLVSCLLYCTLKKEHFLVSFCCLFVRVL